MRALEKNPGDRFQNADAFIAALDAALRAGDELRGGTAAFAPLPPAVMDEAAAAEMDQREERERRRRRRLLALAAIAALIAAIAILALTRDTTTDVPKVTGNQLNVAIALLQQDGFQIGDVKRVEREVQNNTVLEQDPAPSPPADQASLDCAVLTFFCSKPKVNLTVSSGPGSAPVPSTAGEPLAKAEEKLEEAGFKAQVSRVNSEEVEKGLVIHSDPSGGSTATRGSTVTLTVSAGPRLVKVPVLVGSQRSVAVQQIRGAGLAPSVKEEESSSPQGQVIRQAPSAGSQVTPGSTVTIAVSKGAQMATVPNVIGKARPDAVSALREAGLDPTVSEQETDVPSKVGKVTDQFPPPGSEVEPGSKVTIVVGKAPPPITAPEEEEEVP
jgi:serine/threonine-protein kinase